MFSVLPRPTLVLLGSSYSCRVAASGEGMSQHIADTALGFLPPRFKSLPLPSLSFSEHQANLQFIADSLPKFSTPRPSGSCDSVMCRNLYFVTFFLTRSVALTYILLSSILIKYYADCQGCFRNGRLGSKTTEGSCRRSDVVEIFDMVAGLLMWS